MDHVRSHKSIQSRLYDDTVSQIGREIHQNGSRSPQVQMSGFISYMRNLQLKGYLLWSVGLGKLGINIVITRVLMSVKLNSSTMCVQLDWMKGLNGRKVGLDDSVFVFEPKRTKPGWELIALES